MRQCWLNTVVMIAVAVAATADCAIGQHLQIRPPVGLPDPRELTGATELADAIEAELRPLLVQHERVDVDRNGRAAVALLCRIRYRVVTAELLRMGSRYRDQGHIAVATGMRLAAVRADLDEQLAAWATAPDGDAAAHVYDDDRVHESLRAFAEGALAATAELDVRDTAELDRRLATAFAPLARAVSELQGAQLSSHWPSRREVGVVSDSHDVEARGPSGPDAVTAPQLHAQIDAVAELIGRPRADRLRRALDLLKRTMAMPDLPRNLRTDLRRYRHTMTMYLSAVVAFQSATWLPPRETERWTDRLRAGAEALAEPAAYPGGRDSAFTFVERLVGAARIMRALTELHTRPRRAGGIDARDLALLLDSAMTSETIDEQLAVLERASRGMTAWRRLDAKRLPRDVRLIDARLRDNAAALEIRLLRDLPGLIDDASSASDPALTSMMRDLEQVAVDLRRLGMLDAWTQRIADIDPDAAEGVDRQLHKMCHWLLDPMRRDDAIRVMDRFETELQHFVPLAYEDALRRGDGAAIEASGGLQQELLDVIAQHRRQWALAWSVGDSASEASLWLTLLHRLTQTMAVHAGVRERHGGARVVNHWAAWDLDPSHARRISEEIVSRLKLGTAMAVRGDRNGLHTQLLRIQRDMPIAQLTGRLMAIIGDALRSLPSAQSHLLSALAQSVGPPESSAWMLEHRRDLAGIARCAYEAAHARRADRPEIASHLNQWIAQHVDLLLERLGAAALSDRAIAPLPGFDGSDPSPDVERIRTPRRRPRR